MPIRLDASGENLAVQLLAALTVGTQDVSFGLWVYNYSDRTTVETDFMLVGDAPATPSTYINLYADFSGIFLFAANNSGVLANGQSLAINTWYWLEWRRVSGVMHCLVFDDSASAVPLVDGTAAMATSYTTLDAVIIGAAQSATRYPDASVVNACLQTGVSWSNAESRLQSQKFGIQKAGGNNRFCWPLENTTAGLAEFTGGPAMVNTGGTNDANRPTQLEAFVAPGGGSVTGVLRGRSGQPRNRQQQRSRLLAYDAPPIRPGTIVPIGQASETDTAQSFAKQKTKAIGQASETDTAQPMGKQKAKAIGQPSEADTAQPMGRQKAKTLGQPSESDSAQAMARQKVNALGQAAETDSAQPMTPQQQSAPAIAVVPPFSRQPVHYSMQRSRLLSYTVAPSSVTVVAIGQAQETDSAQAITKRKTKAIGQASETDNALGVTHQKVKLIGQATETDSAQSCTRIKRRAIGQAQEGETAQPLGAKTVVPLGQAQEADSALPCTRTKRRQMGVATSADSAQAFFRRKARGLGQAIETNLALPVTAPGFEAPTGPVDFRLRLRPAIEFASIGISEGG